MPQPTLLSWAPSSRMAAPSAKGGGGHRKLGSSVIRLLQGPAVVALAVAAALAVSTPAPAAPPPAAGSSEPLCNLPPELSGEQGEKKSKIRHPKSDQAARCTSKCVSTCVLGGYGAPGVGGPFNVRRPLVVFKDTFRSRQYCLAECSDICNLIKDGEDDQ